MARYSKAITQVNKALSKKGKIKGKNKKETKLLKSICMHHRITRRGKLKPAYYMQGDECICKLCHARFPARFYSKEDVADVVDPMIEMNNQLKYLAAAANLGQKTSDYAANMGAELAIYKKTMKKATAVADKKGKVKKKRKKAYSGSEKYGSWGTKRR